MKYVFIVNPHAGPGGAEARIREGISYLEVRDDCEVYLTKGVGDALEYIKNRCESEPGESFRFIACGGDGTINEVINGAVGHENVSVSCYPCGSGNDFVKSFGGAKRFLNVGKLVYAPTQKLDLLKVGDRYSDNVVNFGFDTAVAITVNEDRAKTGHGSKGSYAKGIVKGLLKNMNNEFVVTADDEVLNPDGKALLCTVANGQYVGGSFRCAPRAKTDDGFIEVCLIRPISRLRFIKIIGTYTEGKHLDDEGMKDVCVYRRAKKVRITGPEGFAYSLDGEIIYEDDFTVEIAPAAIDFAVPEK